MKVLTFDEWFERENAASFDSIYMGNHHSVVVAMRVLARALRDYATYVATSGS